MAASTGAATPTEKQRAATARADAGRRRVAQSGRSARTCKTHDASLKAYIRFRDTLGTAQPWLVDNVVVSRILALKVQESERRDATLKSASLSQWLSNVMAAMRRQRDAGAQTWDIRKDDEGRNPGTWFVEDYKAGEARKAAEPAALARQAAGAKEPVKRQSQLLQSAELKLLAGAALLPVEHLLVDAMCVGRAALLRPGEIMRLRADFETELGDTDADEQPYAVVVAPRRKKLIKGKAPCVVIYSDARAADTKGLLDPFRCWGRMKDMLDAWGRVVPAEHPPCVGDMLLQLPGKPRLNLAAARDAGLVGSKFRSLLAAMSARAGLAEPVMPYDARHSALPAALESKRTILQQQGDWGCTDSMWAYTKANASEASRSLRHAWRTYDAFRHKTRASKRARSATPKATSHSGSKLVGAGSAAGDAGRTA